MYDKQWRQLSRRFTLIEEVTEAGGNRLVELVARGGRLERRASGPPRETLERSEQNRARTVVGEDLLHNRSIASASANTIQRALAEAPDPRHAWDQLSQGTQWVHRHLAPFVDAPPLPDPAELDAFLTRDAAVSASSLEELLSNIKEEQHSDDLLEQ